VCHEVCVEDSCNGVPFGLENGATVFTTGVGAAAAVESPSAAVRVGRFAQSLFWTHFLYRRRENAKCLVFVSKYLNSTLF
jgi:hypothetical protein